MLWPGVNTDRKNRLIDAASRGGIKRIVLVRCQKIGDMLTFLPTMLEVRRLFPEAEITLICLKAAAEIAERIPFVKTIFLDELKRTTPGIINTYDLMITSAADAGKVKLKKQLKIKFAVGALPESLRGICLKHRLQYRYFDAVERYKEDTHEVERNLGMLRLFTRGELNMTERTLWILPSERERANAGLPGTQRPLVLISSSGSRPNQNWSSVLFAALCDRLIQERGATVVFVGKGELAEQHTGDILKAMKMKAFSLVNKTSLGELCALVEMADIMISVDTGTAHLASYLNCPLVVIFGPGDLHQWGPWHIQKKLGTALSVPCNCATPQPKCLENRHCLDALEPGRVFDAAVKLIDMAKDAEGGN